ncbi:hypothetical protein FB45DRAFT_898842 [Roridomyces roridus]|uniref:F-box domain-containing protein n=1 Tax=Roridomyces roridus TaxID=1738132 RepID=A0AAD7CCA9_9AGAR|nr:hypothetical protein FB45DRAFT_898842 [Roridomyces roridus]
MTNFADMPPEVLCHILSLLDPASMLGFSSVSRAWHQTITTSPALQYAAELWKNGLLDAGLDPSPVADKLQALVKRRRTWQTLQWRSETVVDVASLHNCFAYDLVGGVFALQGRSPDFSTLSLPHLGANAHFARHPLGIELEKFEDFAMDPTQDLFVALYYPGSGLASLVFRTLSSHEPHPCAGESKITFPVEGLPQAIRLADDVIGVSFVQPGRLQLWNWRTGVLIVDHESTTEHLDFQFLSPRSFVLTSPLDTGRIDLFTLTAHGAVGTSRVASLCFPELSEDLEEEISAVRIRSQPLCAHPTSGRFRPANERRVFFIVLEYPDDLESLYLVVHHRTFMRYMRESACSRHHFYWPRLVLPHHSMYTAKRVLMPTSEKKHIQILDFGPTIASGATEDTDSLVVRPSTIPNDGPFKYPDWILGTMRDRIVVLGF